jgi:hypothetical protein
LSGLERRLSLGLTWLALALYTLAPAVPQAAMPAFMTMPGMVMAVASMPDDCPMDSHAGHDTKSNDHKATHDCPICKVAATAVLLSAPPILPSLAAVERNPIAASLWRQPSQPVAAAQPRGPPGQI